MATATMTKFRHHLNGFLVLLLDESFGATKVNSALKIQPVEEWLTLKIPPVYFLYEPVAAIIILLKKFNVSLIAGWKVE